jgi:amino acid permease
MKYNTELLQVTIFLCICLYLLRHYYKREKKKDTSNETEFSTIYSFRGYSYLIFVSVICIIKIIVEIIKIIH